jgi:hypothetical protein
MFVLLCTAVICSAKSGENVDKVFEDVARRIIASSKSSTGSAEGTSSGGLKLKAQAPSTSHRGGPQAADCC